MDQTGFRDWLCRRLVAESRDAIIFADKDGLIRLWNAGAEAMFGYRAAEMEGQSLDRIIPEALRARHNEGFRRVMAKGESRYAADLLAVPGLRKDGARISLEFTITLIKDDEGRSWGPQPSSGTSPFAGSGTRNSKSAWRRWRAGIGISGAKSRKEYPPYFANAHRQNYC